VATTRVDHSVHPAQVVPDLNLFLRDARKIGPEFVKAMRLANIEVSDHVVRRAKAAASTPAERAVAKGLVSKPDLIPKIEVDKRRTYVSSSRPNARRKAAGKARIIDVFFGTEFGGGKYRDAGSDTNRVTNRGRLVRKGGGYTTQFRPHMGTQGYFFYPTVRREGRNIEAMYAEQIDIVRKRWERGQL